MLDKSLLDKLCWIGAAFLVSGIYSLYLTEVRPELAKHWQEAQHEQR